jgi:hypothetical protein
MSHRHRLGLGRFLSALRKAPARVTRFELRSRFLRALLKAPRERKAFPPALLPDREEMILDPEWRA